ncbi:MAG: chemotaxis protein CheW [Magnetovibrionaceae bacterium]
MAQADFLTEPQDGRESSSTQFVTFTLGSEGYGVDIHTVREIRVWSETTDLPNAPQDVKGVINLRGVIVPVFDLRFRFGKGATTPSKRHVVVIIALTDHLIGILVDAVSDIVEVQPSELRPVPELEFGRESDFLKGLVAIGDQMIAILDPQTLMRGHVVAQLTG